MLIGWAPAIKGHQVMFTDECIMTTNPDVRNQAKDPEALNESGCLCQHLPG